MKMNKSDFMDIIKSIEHERDYAINMHNQLKVHTNSKFLTKTANLYRGRMIGLEIALYYLHRAKDKIGWNDYYL